MSMEQFPSLLESEVASALLQISDSATSPYRNSPPHVWHRASAILKLISGGCYTEVKIRQEFGDSPDTSKALRMLLKHKKVKRSGTGGRKDPFIYMIA